MCPGPESSLGACPLERPIPWELNDYESIHLQMNIWGYSAPCLGHFLGVLPVARGYYFPSNVCACVDLASFLGGISLLPCLIE